MPIILFGLIVTNPNPALITEPMWGLWVDCPIPGARLSGFYANKPGYHNSVVNNLAKWPNNYSIKLPLDLPAINRTKSRAIDLTLSDAEMIRVTRLMKNSALDPRDTRLDAVKEFYGTLDGKVVYGLSKDTVHGDWERSSADSSHLWHVHTSIFTIFVNNWKILAPILSVWRGESFEEWKVKEMFLPHQGETSEEVKYWQILHNSIRTAFNPELPEIKQDADYGPATAAAFISFWKAAKGTGAYDGSYLSSWIAIEYQKAFAKEFATALAPDETALKSFVSEWLAANVGTEFDIAGTLQGKVSIR